MREKTRSMLPSRANTSWKSASVYVGKSCFMWMFNYEDVPIKKCKTFLKIMVYWETLTSIPNKDPHKKTWKTSICYPKVNHRGYVCRTVILKNSKQLISKHLSGRLLFSKVEDWAAQLSCKHFSKDFTKCFISHFWKKTFLQLSLIIRNLSAMLYQKFIFRNFPKFIGKDMY